MRTPIRLYFFPAFLPLAELLPWLLTAFGALASFLIGAGSKRHSKALVWAGRVLFAAALLGAGWYAAPRAWWWLHQGESRLSATLPLREVLSAVPEEEVAGRSKPYRPGAWALSWRVAIPRRALSSPYRAGSLVVFGTWEGTVDAFSLADGKPVWSVKKHEPVFAVSVASPSLLLAGEGLHTAGTSSLTAIRLPGGEPLWQREFQGHIESEPAYSADKNKIWLGTGPGGLWCLDARDGSVGWHAAVGHVDSTPLLEGGLLYFSSQPEESRKESVFWAVYPDSGKVAWSVPLPGQPWGSPHFDPASGLILTSTGIGQIGVSSPEDRGWSHGISPAEKRVAWTTPLPGNPIEASVRVAPEGLVIHALTKGALTALRPRDGSVAWSLALPGPVQADLALDPASAVVAATGEDGLVTLADARTGRSLETRKFDPGTNSAPLFLTGGIVIATPYFLQRFRW